MKKYQESDDFLAHVTDISGHTTSVTHYCDFLNISTTTHYAWLKTHENYAKAYRRGVHNQCEKAYTAIDEIFAQMSDKASSAKLDAAKYMLERADRLYLINAASSQYNFAEGTIQERFKKVFDSYVKGFISQLTFKTMTAALKIEAEIENPEIGKQIVFLKVDKDDEKL